MKPIAERKTVRTAGCFLEYGGKFLILQRHQNKPQGGTWGLPAGKVSTNESDVQTILREIREETGYQAQEEELEFLGEFSWKFPEHALEFPTFRIKLQKPVEIHHRSDEHQAFKWVTAEECYAMPDLIHGFHDLLKKVGYVE